MSNADAISWLAERAIPLDSVVVATGSADLAPMRHAWSDVRIIGLGEATHGSSEFFSLKHRLIEFLVVELGARVVALEASESAATVVDDFVTHGVGDRAQALERLAFWTWHTREALALLEWLRAHNAELALENRVRFVGIDPQVPAVAVEVVRSYLVKVAPAELPRFTDALTALAQSRLGAPALPESVSRSVEEIVEIVNQRQPAHLSNEGDRARRHAAYLVRSARLATAAREPEAGEASVYAVRDRLMADAVGQLLSAQDHSGPQVAVWAHNGHVQTGDGSGSHHPSMGACLREEFGQRYYALGLMFGSGGFRARRARIRGGHTSSPVTHRRGTVPDITVEGQLAKAYAGDHLVDLRDQDAPRAATEWLGTRSWTRQHGAMESLFYRMGFTPTTPGAEYDGLAYVHLTTPSIALASA